MEENLVETHPRDSLIIWRENNLKVRRQEAAARAQEIYDRELWHFAKDFLADQSLWYSSLTPRQKKELEKLLVSKSKKIIVCHTGFWVGYVIGVLSAFYISGNAEFLAGLFGLAGSAFSFDYAVDCFDFLHARKILKSVSAEEIASLNTKSSEEKNASGLYSEVGGCTRII